MHYKSRKHKQPFWNNMNVPEARIGRGGTAASGQFGQLPQSLVNAKFESTKLRENKDELYNYYRDMLTYTGPDPELFESEQKRTNTMSTSRLNLLNHGSRSEFVPNHPDLFLGDTEPDPRGHTGQFDMSKIVDAVKFRVKRYTHFFHDGDDSITERYRSEAEVRDDKRKGFDWLRDRMQWFTDSVVNTTNKESITTQNNTRVGVSSRDDTPVELNLSDDVKIYDRTQVSNTYAGGWNTNTDHYVMAASYQNTVKMLDSAKLDKANNTYNSELSTSGPIEFADNDVAKQAIYDVTRKIAERSDSIPAGFQLHMEEKFQMYKRNSKNPRGMRVGDTEETQSKILSMVDSTRKTGKYNTASNIAEDTQTKTASIVDNNRTQSDKFDNPGMRHLSNIISDGREIYNTPYSSAKVVTKNNYNGEETQLRGDNTISQDRKESVTNIRSRLNAEEDMEHKEFNVFESGSVGVVNPSKTRRVHMNNRLPNNDMVF